MTELHEQLAEIRDDFRPDWDEEKVDEVLAGVPKRRRHRRNRKIAVAAAALLALGGLAALVTSLAGPAPAPASAPQMAEKVPEPPEPDPEPEPDPNVMVLADGSRITPHDGGIVTVGEATDATTPLQMKDGRTTFEITAAPRERYVLALGKVELEASNATFEVERSDGSVTIDVSSGALAVRIDGTDHETLGEGDRATYPLDGDVSAVPIIFAPEHNEATKPVEREPEPDDAWLDLARDGAWEKADRALRSADRVEGIEALLLAADVKRYSGQPAAAIPLLERAVRDYPSDERATMAQFQRGRIEMQLGRNADAARSWSKVGEISPESPLVEDALSREVEAWYRAGETERARQRAERYLERYPDGYRAPMVRRYGGISSQ